MLYNPLSEELYFLKHPFMILKEGLICSYSINDVIRILSRNLNLKKLSFEYGQYRIMDDISLGKSEFEGIIFKSKASNGTETIRIIVPSDEGRGMNRKRLDRYLTPSGYDCYNSEENYYENEETGFIFSSYNYEKKFDIDATDFIKRKVGTLYHLTPRKYLRKILRQGLKPKKSEWRDFKHNERLYFFISKPDEFEIESFNYGKDIDDEYVLLEIPVSKIGNITFYYDPRKSDSVYTYDSISPEIIKIDNEIL